MSKKKNPANQTMPLKVKNEGRIFAVTLAVSRSRAAKLLKDETVAMGVISVRRLTGEEKDSLDDSGTIATGSGFVSNEFSCME